MSESDWEDVTTGPTSSGSSSEWEDIAIGPRVAPQAEPLNPRQDFTGGLIDIADKMSFGAGDELVAGIGNAVDWTANKLANWTTGADVPQDSNYDQKLAQARDLKSGYEQAHPVGSLINNAPAFFAPVPKIFSAEKGVAPALGNIAKGSGIGAGYGGASGFLSSEGGLDNRLQGAKSGATVGALTGGVLQTASEGLQGIANRAPEFAASQNRKSIGTRQTDYQQGPQSIEELATFGDPTQVESKTKTALDDLLKTGSLGESRDPRALLIGSGVQQKALSDEIGRVVSAYDKAQGKGQAAPVHPAWDEAMNFLASGQGGERTEAFLKKLSDLDSLIQQEGGGRLRYLQAQKIAKGKQWDANDSLVNDFNRAIYADMQKTIEDAVPQVKPLNDQLGKYITVHPILKRGLATLENKDLGTKIINFSKTTGGAMGGVIAGGTLGGLPGAVLGLGVGVGARYLTSPTGRKLTADLADNLGPKFATASNLATQSIPAASQAITPQGERSPKYPAGIDTRKEAPQLGLSRGLSPSSQPTPPKTTAQQDINNTPIALQNMFSSQQQVDPFNAVFGGQNMDTNVPAQLVQAVTHQESAGNPRAISPKGAAGLMQVMPATYREWAPKVGLAADSDPLDPANNQKVGTAYLGYLMQRYGNNVPLALAAYNWGMGNLDKAIAAQGTTDIQLLAHHMPEETRSYVTHIMAALPQNFEVA